MVVGHLGQDPKETPAGYAKLSIATSENFKDKSGELKQTTQWHSVIVFNEHLAKYALKSLKKGMMVYAEGKLTYRDAEDKKGVKKTYVDIIIGKQNGDLKVMNRPKELENQRAQQPKHNADSVDKYFDRY